MNRGFVLAVLSAQVIFSPSALGQELIPVTTPYGGEIQPEMLWHINNTVPGRPLNQIVMGGDSAPQHGYGQRAATTVYDCFTDTAQHAAFFLGSCANTIGLCSFTNGPWATPAAGHAVTFIGWGAQLTGSAVDTEEMWVIIWPKNAVNLNGYGISNTGDAIPATGSSQVNPQANPLAVYAYGIPDWIIVGNHYHFTAAFATPVTIPASDDGVYVQFAWMNGSFIPAADPGNANNNAFATGMGPGTYGGCPYGTNDRVILIGSASGASYPTSGTPPFTAAQWAGSNPCTVGYNNGEFGRDISGTNVVDFCPNKGTFIGHPVTTGGGSEHRVIANPGSNSVAFEFMMQGQGMMYPDSATELGCIPDSGLTTSSSVAASSTVWYKLCLNGDATDEARQFLDIDTEGSAGDVAIGLFESDGSLIAADDNSGSGMNAQLTFGVGIRAAAGGGGGGLQYNGRSGELLATAGENLWLAVAPGGSAFGSGFDSLASSNAGGAFQINIATNTNGAALAPSVPPTVVQDVGDITAPAVSTAAAFTEPRTALFWKFHTSFDAGGGNPCRYLDIHMNGSGNSPSADTAIFIFDHNGLLVGYDDDSGPLLLSQASFGIPSSAGGPPPRVSDGGDGSIFDSQNGALSSGDYWLGVGLNETRQLREGDRFHLRATLDASLFVAPVWRTDYDGTNRTCCPMCAADYNKDGGVTGEDIAAFFPDWESGVPCADVNQDGGIDGADIGAFFEVWERGGC